MKRRIRLTLSSLGVAACALLLAVSPTWAASFVLTDWNNAVIEGAGATVTVNVTEGGGNTTLVVTYQPGTFTNTLLGIDQFDYGRTGDTSTFPTTFPAGWKFKAGDTLDGFGLFNVGGARGGGTDLSLTFIIAGTGLGLDDKDDFGAHLRFASTTTCSGFVGGHDVPFNGADTGCGGTNTAEPSVLALAGFGLVAVGLVSRRWRKKQ
jgi:hypothetical protein